MPQIVPTVATSQQVYDALNISAAQAAALLPNGTTTLAAFIAAAMDRTATAIVAELGYDFTPTQSNILRTFGNDTVLMPTRVPVSTITGFHSMDSNGTVVDEGSTHITVSSSDPYVLIRNDGKQFDKSLWYTILYTQAADERYPAPGFPTAVIGIQIEMIAVLWRESANMRGSIGEAEIEGQQGRPLKYRDMWPNWKLRLRPFKHFAA